MNRVLKARIRKRDTDIRKAVEELRLEEGEMADMIRDGFRFMLMLRDDPRKKLLGRWLNGC